MRPSIHRKRIAIRARRKAIKIARLGVVIGAINEVEVSVNRQVAKLSGYRLRGPGPHKLSVRFLVLRDDGEINWWLKNR